MIFDNLFNDIDLWSSLSLTTRFLFNFFVAYLIINQIYHHYQRNKEYFFTFYTFNAIIFCVCYAMNSIEIGAGFGMGLFAVFSILRYRTSDIPAKEMTYLFAVIAVGLVNALIGDYATLLLVNAIIVGVPYYLERNHRLFQESVKSVVYEKIELIQAHRRDELLADLRQRTGLNIHRIEIQRVDFMRDIARIKVYYYE